MKFTFPHRQAGIVAALNALDAVKAEQLLEENHRAIEDAVVDATTSGAVLGTSVENKASGVAGTVAWTMPSAPSFYQGIVTVVIDDTTSVAAGDQLSLSIGSAGAPSLEVARTISAASLADAPNAIAIGLPFTTGGAGAELEVTAIWTGGAGTVDFGFTGSVIKLTSLA